MSEAALAGSETPLVAHVDMDAFYVSVELGRRPELRGLPVVVCGEGPRAVVTTASYEARRFGIFSATPAAWARRRCPEAVFVRPDFDLYRARSREVMAVLGENFDVLEVVGLDEAYVDLCGLERPRSAARRAQAAIRERTGLVCSIGVGPSKLVAKVASDCEKPEGFVTLTSAEARERFAAHSPGLIPGIGPRTVERLAARGITTLDALGSATEEDLAAWFGTRLGPSLGRLARFEDDRPVRPVRAVKSESRETTFSRDRSDPEALERTLRELADELCRGLVAKDRRGRTIGIKVRLDDFSTHTRARTLPAATAEPSAVAGVATALLREFAPARP
ncbi:MAG TPA: DNA polymerase IV, partial [Thermoleophilaceae bacterium]|nr:DNA polymerase IV [Thermoleophilaceae bacterium]